MTRTVEELERDLANLVKEREDQKLIECQRLGTDFWVYAPGWPDGRDIQFCPGCGSDGCLVNRWEP